MKLVTWNVNSLRQRLPRLLPWLDERRPDVVCLQETKLADDAFEELFGRGDPQAVIRLVEDLLRESGGPLFDGFRADAPAAWRRQPHSTSARSDGEP